jgi:hypothetical protein
MCYSFGGKDVKAYTRFLIFSICALLMLTGVTGCSPDGDPGPTGPLPIEGNPSGTATAKGDGFARSLTYYAEAGSFGKQITVMVTLDNGFITDVVIDATSSATTTLKGIKEAGNGAIAKIKAGEFD